MPLLGAQQHNKDYYDPNVAHAHFIWQEQKKKAPDSAEEGGGCDWGRVRDRQKKPGEKKPF